MISSQQQLYDQMSDGHFTSLLEAAGDAVFGTDTNGLILFSSQRTQSLLGAEFPLVGRVLRELLLEADRKALDSAIDKAVRENASPRINVRFATSGLDLWLELQVSVCRLVSGAHELLVVGRDISAQQATEERLRYMATHDALTGLPNRSLLADRLRMAIANSRRTGGGFSVLALDLDGFKKVNDALGHPIGDALLRVAAMRLADSMRDVDTLARVGGDEFIMVLPGAVSPESIQLVARRMISCIQLPFEIEGHSLYVSGSIGVAIYPDHADSEVKLLAYADTAMYRAKETGKSRCVIFDPVKFNHIEHDVSLEAAMFEAVRNGEFLLYYQPIVDARDASIVGFEALMRWMHPELGMISPAQFIPMAEENGLINLLGSWVLKAACMQVRKFEQVLGRELYISVNVSPRQFRNDQFLDAMDSALKLSGLPSKQLLLEITEGILMSDPEHAEALLTSISGRGVRIAIDDFGTGYSSLAYLKRFPISSLKIDRAFIKDLPASVKDTAICKVILSLAKHLGLSTIAEGVEEVEQLQFLAEQGCTYTQGYLTGRPIPPDAVLELLGGTQKKTLKTTEVAS